MAPSLFFVPRDWLEQCYTLSIFFFKFLNLLVLTSLSLPSYYFPLFTWLCLHLDVSNSWLLTLIINKGTRGSYDSATRPTASWFFAGINFDWSFPPDTSPSTQHRTKVVSNIGQPWLVHWLAPPYLSNSFTLTADSGEAGASNLITSLPYLWGSILGLGKARNVVGDDWFGFRRQIWCRFKSFIT